jgi:hypothetical protein
VVISNENAAIPGKAGTTALGFYRTPGETGDPADWLVSVCFRNQQINSLLSDESMAGRTNDSLLDVLLMPFVAAPGFLFMAAAAQGTGRFDQSGWGRRVAAAAGDALALVGGMH